MWTMTADAVAVQTEADIKASNTQAKRIKLHLQVSGPTHPKTSKKSVEQNFQKLCVEEGLLHSSPFSENKK